MKKFLALLMTCTLVFAFAGCGAEDINAKSEGVMTYAEYDAAALDTEVVVETYVQAKQSWWDNTATVYTQDGEGGYFLYNMACSEEDYAKCAREEAIRMRDEIKSAVEALK